MKNFPSERLLIYATVECAYYRMCCFLPHEQTGYF